ncbi:fusicoccadiene synthase [Diaporthe sp. PMI_573]|nr:fusicoccadiene synthase [Diaporthaceae sp. PMI_573]
MEFKYSEVVDPSTYHTEGLCDGIDVRRNKYTFLEDRGAIRAHEDWHKHIAPCRKYRGTLGPRFSFISVAVPECIPERLEVISYANEFAFLHDDVTDHVSYDKGEVENNEMMTAFLEAANTGTIDTFTPDTRREGKKRIQSQLFLEMLAIDPECAKTTMKSWARFVEVGSSRQHETRFVKLAKYIPYRIMDVGEMFWFGLVTFGLGLHIPDHELDLCRELMSHAWIAVGLQNDIWSWPKERDAARLHGKDHVVNAIWVLMQEHQTDVDGAMQICRKLIVDHVAKYLDVIEANKNDESISLDLRKYLDVMLYSISGNVVWSLECPRYNPDINFNETQLEWMRQGLPPRPELSPSLLVNLETVSADESDSTVDSDKSGDTQRDSSPSSVSSCSLSRETSAAAQETHTHKVFEREVLEAPYKYIASMPSKGIRDHFIDALNEWLRVPQEKVQLIKHAIRILHNASLLLDDFQDNSPLRRGKPATHTMFGPAQTVNTAAYSIIRAIGQIMEFSTGSCAREIINSITALFQGQAMDLFWTHNGRIPLEEEYYRMVDQKTGQLFLIATDLMLDAAEDAEPRPELQSLVHRLTTLLGRCFQIRDDYQNLVSADYTKQKGFCEDLDEGKWSLPLIHLFQAEPSHMAVLNMLSTGRKHGGMTLEQKQFVLEAIEDVKGLEYARSVMADMHLQLCAEVRKIEDLLGLPNPNMRVMLELLRI